MGIVGMAGGIEDSCQVVAGATEGAAAVVAAMEVSAAWGTAGRRAGSMGIVCTAVPEGTVAVAAAEGALEVEGSGTVEIEGDSAVCGTGGMGAAAVDVAGAGEGTVAVEGAAWGTAS